MSKRCFLMATAMFAVILQPPASNANDSITLIKPEKGQALLRAYAPREKPVLKASTPITSESVFKAVDTHIQALFDRAADPSTHLVTVTSADKAGLGFFIDHFAEIDSDRDGTLEFGEVKGFLDARSPIARPASKEIKTIEQKGIQIIE